MVYERSDIDMIFLAIYLRITIPLTLFSHGSIGKVDAQSEVDKQF